MPIVGRGPKVAKLELFRDLVAIAPASPQEKVGGIFLPQEAQRVQIYGRIVGMGPDVPTDVHNVGDTVVFSQYAGTEVKQTDLEGDGGDVTILIMPYKQMLARITTSYKGDKPIVSAPDTTDVDPGATA